MIAREFHITPREVREMDNLDFMAVLAMMRLESERAHHAAVHARNRR